MNPNKLPEVIEQLSLEHDRLSGDVIDRTRSLLEQSNDVTDKESAHDLAGSLDDIATELQHLLTEKDEAGYFAGTEGASQHARERVERLRSGQRHVISELQAVAREFRSGKASKAKRKLSTWASKFEDVSDRESRHINELWSEA